MEVRSLHSLTTLFTIFLFCSSHVHPISGSKTPKNYANLVKKSCNATTYPSLCIKTLNPYASTVRNNRFKLCKTALNVAIQATNKCSANVSPLVNHKGLTRPEGRVVKDCIGNLKDVVYELKRTVNAMGHLRDGDREFQWDNAKTYASAAITDADTCIDGLLERKSNPNLKNKIRGCVTYVEKLISNALSLINHLY